MVKPAREFIFLRHGETEYNREGRFQGRTDVPLNAAGLAQAQAVVAAIAGLGISRAVSSPARRVLQTVRPFAEANAIPLEIDHDLMEFFVGAFEGKRIASIRETHDLRDDASWFSVLPDDADSWHEFVPRVCSAVWRWTEQHPDETILVASHGLVFRALTQELVGKPSVARNGEAHHFRPSGDGWDVSTLD